MMTVALVLPTLCRKLILPKPAIECEAWEWRPTPVGAEQRFYVKNCATEDEVSRVLIGRILTWLADKPGTVVVFCRPIGELRQKVWGPPITFDCQIGKWHAYTRLGIAAE